LRCIQTHPHYYDLFLSSEILLPEMEFAIRQSIISGSALGAKYHVIHPRTSTSTSAYGSRTSLKDNLGWIGGLLECAVKHGTQIAVENLPIFPSAGKLFYFYSANVEDHMELVDAFSDPSLVACWDFGHANLSASDQARAIEMMGSRIRCTHVHNNFGYGDRHLPPDCGDIAWDQVMGALKRTGYTGALTLETHCQFLDKDFLLSFARHNLAGLRYLEGLFK
jgi:sugar phosphate isomerase/epimerase